MGGLLLVLSMLATSLLWMRLDNPSLWMCLLLCWVRNLGFKDDYDKIAKNNAKGISATKKLFWQTIIASVVCYYNYYYLQPPETARLLSTCLY